MRVNIIVTNNVISLTENIFLPRKNADAIFPLQLIFTSM